FEPFHNTPALRHVRSCLRKQLAWHHELSRRARAPSGDVAAEAVGALDQEACPRQEGPYPWLVLVTTGRPEAGLEGVRVESLSAGVYGAAPALQIRVVLLSEVPRTRGTLILRLMGTRRVLRDALQDLTALPDDAWEKGVALPLLVHFGYEVPAEPIGEDEEE